MTKKPVGLNYFKAKVKELEEKKVFYFDEEENEYITYSVKFSQSKIDATIEELIQTLIHCEKNGIEEMRGSEMIVRYTNFLIFKNFTDTEKLLKGKDIDYILKFEKTVHDLGLVNLFVESVFDSLEIEKVFEKLHEIDKKAKTLIPQIERLEKENEKLKKYKNK